jgi:endonuclease YncB( thermonuclease family)
MLTIAPATLTAHRAYPDLRRAVEQTLLTGQRAIERAKVRTYWETGWLINEHILLNGGRADYGAKVFLRLERDLKVSRRILYQCAQFARRFPILNVRSQLSWAHFRTLCQVADDVQRKTLELQAEKSDWNVAQLELRVREFNLIAAADVADSNDGRGASAGPGPNLLTSRRGTPGLHLVVERDGRLVVDLGFKLYRPIEPEQANRFEPGSIVRLGEERISRVVGATKADLYTYAVCLRRLIDGDTFVVELEVAPLTRLEVKLRLRGLDCPEISTAEGRAAKRYVDGLLTGADALTLTTTKPDKYDRYLADIFLTRRSGDEIFLNNALLENGHAGRKDDWEFRDWEKEMVG